MPFFFFFFKESEEEIVLLNNLWMSSLTSTDYWEGKLRNPEILTKSLSMRLLKGSTNKCSLKIQTWTGEMRLMHGSFHNEAQAWKHNENNRFVGKKLLYFLTQNVTLTLTKYNMFYEADSLLLTVSRMQFEVIFRGSTQKEPFTLFTSCLYTNSWLSVEKLPKYKMTTRKKTKKLLNEISSQDNINSLYYIK